GGVHRRRLIDANPAGGVLGIFANYRSRGLRNEILIDDHRRSLRRLLVDVSHWGLTATVIGVNRDANRVGHVDDVAAAAASRAAPGGWRIAGDSRPETRTERGIGNGGVDGRVTRAREDNVSKSADRAVGVRAGVGVGVRAAPDCASHGYVSVSSSVTVSGSGTVSGSVSLAEGGH